MVANRTVVVNKVTLSTYQVEEPFGLVSVLGFDVAIRSPMLLYNKLSKQVNKRTPKEVQASTNDLLVRSSNEDKEKSLSYEQKS